MSVQQMFWSVQNSGNNMQFNERIGLKVLSISFFQSGVPQTYILKRILRQALSEGQNFIVHSVKVPRDYLSSKGNKPAATGGISKGCRVSKQAQAK